MVYCWCLLPTQQLFVISIKKLRLFISYRLIFFHFESVLCTIGRGTKKNWLQYKYRSLQNALFFFQHFFGKLNCKIVFINCHFLAIVMIDTIALFFSPQNLCSFITSYISWKVILDQYGPTWNYTQNIFICCWNSIYVGRGQFFSVT